MEYFVKVDGWGFKNKETGEIIAVQKLPKKKRYQLLHSVGLSMRALGIFNTEADAITFCAFLRAACENWNNGDE